MEVYQIILIVLASILGLYLLIVITDIIFVGSFSSIMKKHKKTLTIILNANHDAISQLINLLNEKNIPISEEILEKYNSFDLKDFKQIGGPSYTKTKKDLSYLRDSLIALCSSKEEIKNDEDFLEIKGSLEELSLNYRSCVIMYNADVLGYNYWIRFLPCRFIFLMFKVKKKDLII